MIPLCRYILKGGCQCQQAAINGEYYCRHHLVVRRTVAANTPKPNPYRIEKPLPLVFPEDRAALMIDVFVVMQAFNEGDIGPKSANIFTRLLHESGVILKAGPLYDTDHENAVRRVVVTPEGEEIAPAREVPEEAEDSEGASDPTSQKRDVGHPAAIETRSAHEGEAVSGETDSEKQGQSDPTSQKRDVGHPDSAFDPNDFACNDPCYVANLTERREQYREFALNDLAAGRDPRAWEDFIPGKSKMRRPAPIPSLHR